MKMTTVVAIEGFDSSTIFIGKHLHITHDDTRHEAVLTSLEKAEGDNPYYYAVIDVPTLELSESYVISFDWA